MKKRMYIIPVSEALEIKTLGVLMGSGDEPKIDDPNSTNYGAPRKRVF